jgi:tetratricopeptide (TPR) repeat protein
MIKSLSITFIVSNPIGRNDLKAGSTLVNQFIYLSTFMVMNLNKHFIVLAFIVAFNWLPFKSTAQSATEYNDNGIKKAKSSDYKGAILEYDKSIELDSTNAIVYYNRGISKARLKDYKGAISDYTKALELRPNDADTYFNRGLARYKDSDYSGAVADLDLVTTLNPGIQAPVYVLRGNARLRLNDFKTALSDFDKAIQYNPADSVAYFNRGLCKQRLNQKEEGCKDFLKARELGFKGGDGVINRYCR